MKKNVDFGKAVVWCIITAVVTSICWICVFLPSSSDDDGIDTPVVSDLSKAGSLEQRFEVLTDSCFKEGSRVAKSCSPVGDEEMRREIEAFCNIFTSIKDIETAITEYPETKEAYQSSLDDFLGMYVWHMGFFKEAAMCQENNEEWLTMYEAVQEEYEQVKVKWRALR